METTTGDLKAAVRQQKISFNSLQNKITDSLRHLEKCPTVPLDLDHPGIQILHADVLRDLDNATLERAQENQRVWTELRETALKEQGDWSRELLRLQETATQQQNTIKERQTWVDLCTATEFEILDCATPHTFLGVVKDPDHPEKAVKMVNIDTNKGSSQTMEEMWSAMEKRCGLA
eukprot:TRINITY_DN70420_c0_g1_i1.p1 TRINITY_DN70420_c0_g1~~TRINITY_DN70420_c0_g1_i1.p1  ORF type:complete len:185 (-),score=36.84 TRINITY_DN70420_c0_g1_i1:73-600(-)